MTESRLGYLRLISRRDSIAFSSDGFFQLPLVTGSLTVAPSSVHNVNFEQPARCFFLLPLVFLPHPVDW
jgi:hypothetical protein